MRTWFTCAALVCSTVVVMADRQAPPAGQNAQGQQPPVFRSAVKVVRVDATVTGRDDKPLPGLQAGDFEVTEDGVPQRIETVQFIQLDGRRPTGDATSLDIRSQTQAEAEAAREDVRVIAIFLDDYHIDKAPDVTMPLRRGLTEFVRSLWPSDLVAIMEPLTPLSALKFTRSQGELLQWVQAFEGRQGELYPIKSPMEEAQWSRGNTRRLRAQVTLSALEALTVKLGGLREGRKSILFVSQGPPTYLGMQEGSLQSEMRAIMDAANRGNVTIYTLDPRTLGTEWRVGSRDTLLQLAADTGGRPIYNTNNFAVGLGRMLVETSAYYVLGYTPTRNEDDGKFHKINVKVKRSGVRVLARQGYWAPSAKEIEAAAEAAAKTPPPSVAQALDDNQNARATRRLASVWTGFAPGQNGKTALTLAWEPFDTQRTEPIGTLEIELLSADGKTSLSAVPNVPATVPGQFVPAGPPIELVPGEIRVRFVAKSQGGILLDEWFDVWKVPDYSQTPVVLSTLRALRARTFAEWKAVQAAPGSRPSAVWIFRRTDRVLISAECRSAAGPASQEIHVLTRDGKELTALKAPALVDGQLRFELPVGSFGQGLYLLRVRTTAGPHQVEQVAAFRLIP